MKSSYILSASILLAAIIYACSTRYAGHVVKNNEGFGGGGSSVVVVDHWTGRIVPR